MSAARCAATDTSPFCTRDIAKATMRPRVTHRCFQFPRQTRRFRPVADENKIADGTFLCAGARLTGLRARQAQTESASRHGFADRCRTIARRAPTCCSPPPHAGPRSTEIGRSADRRPHSILAVQKIHAMPSGGTDACLLDPSRIPPDRVGDRHAPREIVARSWHESWNRWTTTAGDSRCRQRVGWFGRPGFLRDEEATSCSPKTKFPS